MATIRGCASLTRLLRHYPKKSLIYKVNRYHSYIGPQSDDRYHMLREFFNRKRDMGPETLYKRSSFLDWNHRSELFAFSKRIGENFVGSSLERAFTHRSHAALEELRQKELGIDDPKGYLEDNQSLAEDGEASTRDFVARYLRTALPCLPEEGIQSIREHLLSDDNIAHILRNIGGEELILCTDFPPEKKTCVTTFYALVGAVEESSGSEKAALFVRDFVVASLSGKDIHGFCMPENAFEVLCEILRRDGNQAPEPRLLSQTGVKTIIPCYRVGLYSTKKFIGSGDGESIEIAKQNAALSVLWQLWGIPDGKFQFPFQIEVSKFISNSLTNIPESDWTSNKALQRASASR